MTDDPEPAKRLPWRPTKYDEETIPKTIDYMTGGYLDYGHIIPSISGLAIALCVSRDTLYEWKGTEGREDFSDILEALLTIQEQSLLTGGLGGSFNSTICKLVLAKHGYADKIETEQKITDDRRPLDFVDAEEAARAYAEEMKR